MKNAELKGSLVSNGEAAFMALTKQIEHLLDLIDFYMRRYPAMDSAKHDGLAFKHEQLKLMVNTLGTLPYQVADQIRRWKHDEPRILSRLGVELELLNEIWITMECTMLFFIQSDMSLDPYNRSKALNAFNELIRVNKLLD